MLAIVEAFRRLIIIINKKAFSLYLSLLPKSKLSISSYTYK